MLIAIIGVLIVVILVLLAIFWVYRKYKNHEDEKQENKPKDKYLDDFGNEIPDNIDDTKLENLEILNTLEEPEYTTMWAVKPGKCANTTQEKDALNSWTEYLDVMQPDDDSDECWYQYCARVSDGAEVNSKYCNVDGAEYTGCVNENNELVTDNPELCATGPLSATGGTNKKIVVRSWGCGGGCNSTPFNRGDYVSVQIAYTYGKSNVQPITSKGGIPIAYYSIGTFESGDGDRVKFYGNDASKMKACTKGSLKGWESEKLYDPDKLSTLLPLQYKQFEKLKSNGAKGIEFDNMDFGNVYDGNSGKYNKIKSYIQKCAQKCKSLGMKVIAKNGAKLLNDINSLFDGLITEEVGDMSSVCQYDMNTYMKYFGKSKGRPWSDFNYSSGKRCDSRNLKKYCNVYKQSGSQFVLL